MPSCILYVTAGKQVGREGVQVYVGGQQRPPCPRGSDSESLLGDPAPRDDDLGNAESALSSYCTCRETESEKQTDRLEATQKDHR